MWYSLFVVLTVATGFTQTVAQTTAISGSVKDQSDGSSLPGASILIKGTPNGTITDANGNFTIEASSNTILVVSSVGYTPQEITVGNRISIEIQLISDIKQLDEIVVVGYGTQKKSDLTGAVSSVKGEDIQKFATNTAADGLQGHVAGLTVRRSSGNPRAGAAINIRGFRSIGGNAPLVIIDGIQGNFDLLNPDDIESIEVLKDGAAAAIYGSLSANGVILVTTKSGGKDGKTNLTFSTYYGVDKISNQLEFANTEQYLEMARKIEASSPGTAPEYINESITTNTNWMDELFRITTLL